MLATPKRVILTFADEQRRTQEYLRSPDATQRARGHARQEQEQQMRAATLRNISIAMQEVMVLNTPERFIVEDAPPGWAVTEARRQRKKHPERQRVLTSRERPVYVLLTPAEIRERFHFPLQTGTVKRAHERRRHLRTYPDDPARWPRAHGKVVVIPSVWVGPSELRVNKRRYRVVLDR